MDSSSFLLTVRVVASLGAVLGLLWFLQRKLGRSGGRRAANDITVLSRKSLGQRSSVVIVDAEGHRFVLGVTEQSVTVLAEAAAPPPVAVLPAGPTLSTGTAPLSPTKAGKTAWKTATAGSILSPDTWIAANKAIKDRKTVKTVKAAELP